MPATRKLIRDPTHERHDLTGHPVRAFELSESGRVIQVTVEGMKPDRIYSIRLKNVRAADGASLTQPVAYYTAHVLK